ncbi:hypothetical protein RQP46_004609 [Phenoliferia psychrophenolica]
MSSIDALLDDASDDEFDRELGLMSLRMYHRTLKPNGEFLWPGPPAIAEHSVKLPRTPQDLLDASDAQIAQIAALYLNLFASFLLPAAITAAGRRAQLYESIGFPGHWIRLSQKWSFQTHLSPEETAAEMTEDPMEGWPA